MNFKTHNDKEVNVGGTSLIGTIDAGFYQIKKVFGKPIPTDECDYKTEAEWHIEFEDGVAATIYDYKVGKKYEGNLYGIAKTKITHWHVGGHDEVALERVKKLLDGEN